MAFDGAHAARQLLFGFAEHSVATTYLGSSTGLRRRGVQRTGRLELNAKTADLASSAWLGRATRDFSDVDIAEAVEELTTRLGWAATKLNLPPGRYETLLPPSAIADLMIYAYWTANARDAEEGRNVFAAGTARPRSGSGWLNSRSTSAQIRCIQVWRPSRLSISPPPATTLPGRLTVACRSTRRPGSSRGTAGADPQPRPCCTDRYPADTSGGQPDHGRWWRPACNR